MAADAIDIHLTCYKEKISPEVKYCVHFAVVCYKNRTFCNGGTVIRDLNSFAVLGYNVEILNVPERDDACKNR